MITYTVSVTDSIEGKQLIEKIKKSKAVMFLKKKELEGVKSRSKLIPTKQKARIKNHVASEKSLAKEWLSKEDERWENYL